MGRFSDLAKADAEVLIDYSPVRACGRVWTAKAAPVTASWRGLAAGNGVLVAVADTGAGNRIMRSVDMGRTWAEVTSTGANALRSVAFGNGVFVAVGNNVCVRSADYGLTWTSVATGGGESIIWDGEAFASCTTGLNPIIIKKSTDLGVTFADVTHDLGWSVGGNMFFSGGKYFVTRSGMIEVSDDLETWTELSTHASAIWVAYDGKRYVVARSSQTTFYYSDDGVTWTASSPVPSVGWGGLTYIHGIFIAFPGNSTTLLFSEDGANWREIVMPETASITRIEALSGRLFGVAFQGTNRIFSSDI